MNHLLAGMHFQEGNRGGQFPSSSWHTASPTSKGSSGLGLHEYPSEEQSMKIHHGWCLSTMGGVYPSWVVSLREVNIPTLMIHDSCQQLVMLRHFHFVRRRLQALQNCKENLKAGTAEPLTVVWFTLELSLCARVVYDVLHLEMFIRSSCFVCCI